MDELECDVWAVDETNSVATVHLSPEQYAQVMSNKRLFTNVTVIDQDLEKSLEMDAIQNTHSKSVKVKSFKDFMSLNRRIG